MGPRSFAKKSNSKNVKTSKHHPKVRTLHLERGWDHFPDPSFSESSFKLLGKIGYSTRDFQTIWRLRISPWLMCWGSRSPAKGPERSQQEGWFFAGNREATNAEFGDSWSLPPVFRLVLLGSWSTGCLDLGSWIYAVVLDLGSWIYAVVLDLGSGIYVGVLELGSLIYTTVLELGSWTKLKTWIHRSTGSWIHARLFDLRSTMWIYSKSL